MSYYVRPFLRNAVMPPAGEGSQQWASFVSERHAQGLPLDIEIGCGVGFHPIRYALENPGRSLIAIEHTREKFEKFQSRVTHHPYISNLLPVHADAVRWITHMLPERSLTRCFLHYPNPEPKAKNKRWFRAPFMHQLLKTLKTNGEILLATNEEWYWLEAREWAKNYWQLHEPEVRSFNQSHLPHGVPRTHFEKKYLLRGETCFDVRFKKS